MKKLFLALSLVVFLFGFVGCEKEPGDGLVLTGTSWRLQGYFDIEANEFTKAMLTEDISVDDCVECYTLKFETDGKVIAQVIDNRFLFKHFLTDSAILSEFIKDVGFRYESEVPYYYAFMSFLNLDESELVAAENVSIPPIPYSIENNTLKIYYTDLYDNNRKNIYYTGEHNNEHKENSVNCYFAVVRENSITIQTISKNSGIFSSTLFYNRQ